MKRASYREAIDWLALNDDTLWLDDDQPIISVATALVVDLFGTTEQKVTADLRRAIVRRLYK